MGKFPSYNIRIYWMGSYAFDFLYSQRAYLILDTWVLSHTNDANINSKLNSAPLMVICWRFGEPQCFCYIAAILAWEEGPKQCAYSVLIAFFKNHKSSWIIVLISLTVIFLVYYFCQKTQKSLFLPYLQYLNASLKHGLAWPRI